MPGSAKARLGIRLTVPVRVDHHARNLRAEIGKVAQPEKPKASSRLNTSICDNPGMTDKERTSTPPSQTPQSEEKSPAPVVRQPVREGETVKSWIGDSSPALGSREESVMERRPIPSDPPPDESKE